MQASQEFSLASVYQFEISEWSVCLGKLYNCGAYANVENTEARNSGVQRTEKLFELRGECYIQMLYLIEARFWSTFCTYEAIDLFFQNVTVGTL